MSVLDLLLNLTRRLFIYYTVSCFELIPVAVIRVILIDPKTWLWNCAIILYLYILVKTASRSMSLCPFLSPKASERTPPLHLCHEQWSLGERYNNMSSKQAKCGMMFFVYTTAVTFCRPLLDTTWQRWSSSWSLRWLMWWITTLWWETSWGSSSWRTTGSL